MSIITWKMDPENPGALIKVDEEEAAQHIWRQICKEKGLPLDTPYVINNDFKNMTWRESKCDGMWRDIYYRKGLLPNTFSSSEDDEEEEEETEKKRNRTPSPSLIPPTENYRKVSRTFEEDRKMLEERSANEAVDRENKKNKKKKRKA